MGDHLKHLRGVEAAAAQALKMLDDCLAVFRRVALDGGELVVETEVGVEMLQLARGLQRGRLAADLPVQFLAERLQIRRIEDVRHNEIALLVKGATCSADSDRGGIMAGFGRILAVAQQPRG
jgi:hypothetical protein